MRNQKSADLLLIRRNKPPALTDQPPPFLYDKILFTQNTIYLV